MREVGLSATEFGPDGFLPGEPDAMTQVLDHHGLRPSVGSPRCCSTRPGTTDPVPEVERLLQGYDASGAGVLVLSAVTGQEGYDTRPGLDEAGWRTLLANLDRLTALAAEHAVRAVLHPHVGTMVENGDEVRRVLEGSSIPLCLDTGHRFIGGTDPAELARQAPGRVQDGRLTYTEGVRDGMYRPLWSGDVDVPAIVGYLRARGYGGWYVLEQDTILTGGPRGDGPAADVWASAEYLRSVLRGTR